MIIFPQRGVGSIFFPAAADGKEKTEDGKENQQINEPFTETDIKGSFGIFGQINFNDFRRRAAAQFGTGEFFCRINDFVRSVGVNDAAAAVVAAADHRQIAFNRTQYGIGKVLFGFAAFGIPGIV